MSLIVFAPIVDKSKSMAHGFIQYSKCICNIGLSVGSARFSSFMMAKRHTMLIVLTRQYSQVQRALSAHRHPLQFLIRKASSGMSYQTALLSLSGSRPL